MTVHQSLASLPSDSRSWSIYPEDFYPGGAYADLPYGKVCKQAVHISDISPVKSHLVYIDAVLAAWTKGWEEGHYKPYSVFSLQEFSADRCAFIDRPHSRAIDTRHHLERCRPCSRIEQLSSSRIRSVFLLYTQYRLFANTPARSLWPRLLGRAASNVRPALLHDAASPPSPTHTMG